MRRIVVMMIPAFFALMALIAGCQAAKSVSPSGGSEEEVAVFQTTKGTFVMEFYPDKAPKTVENFKKLIRKGFYDGLTFHRYVPEFVIQGGDPKVRGGHRGRRCGGRACLPRERGCWPHPDQSPGGLPLERSVRIRVRP